MFDRARNLRRLGLACLVLTLGCKPDPVTEDPEPKPDAGGPTDSVTTGDSSVGGDSAEAEAGDDSAGDDGSSDAAVDPTVADGGDTEPNADTDDGNDEPPATTVADASKPEKPEKEPLPKPIHQLKGKTCQQSFNVGTNVKGFRLPSVDGQKNISPNNYRKRVVLLNFWGTWCKPCLEELPEFDRLYRKYRKHGLTLVAVATDEEPEPVQAFIDKHKLRAKIALEGEEVAGAYNRPNFPFSFVIDGSGKIVAAYEYVNDACMGDLEQVLRDELEKLDR